MELTPSVRTCRWGTPTLFLPWPIWCDASQHEWSCTRGATPLTLADPGVCRACQPWQPADRPWPRPDATGLPV